MKSKANIPDIASSTREERLGFIRERFRCISDCDQCGICKTFHNRDAEDVFADYIEGFKTFDEAMLEARSL